jgi:hypothetical protein
MRLVTGMSVAYKYHDLNSSHRDFLAGLLSRCWFVFVKAKAFLPPTTNMIRPTPNADLRAVEPTDRCDTRTLVSCGPRTTAWNLTLRAGQAGGRRVSWLMYQEYVPPRDVILGSHPGPKERPLLLLCSCCANSKP